MARHLPMETGVVSAVAGEGRRQRLAALIERFPHQDPAQFADPVADLVVAGRFLLVEQSRYDARHFLSAHADPGEAAAYCDGQEYPGDWKVVTLVGLDTGEESEAEQRTRFTGAGGPS